jgi:hypothetical protein
MTKEEFFIQMLPLIMAQDIRLQVHSLHLVDKSNEWSHDRKKCARCVALMLLRQEEEL